jgi:hypothetical protein
MREVLTHDWRLRMPREIPKEINEKLLAWRHWSSVWSWAHDLTGFTSAALTTVIAANAKAQFMGPILTTVIAALAAGLAFLVTTLGAQTKAKGFELAARALETAIAKFRFNDKLPDTFLGDAEAKGIDILNSIK